MNILHGRRTTDHDEDGTNRDDGSNPAASRARPTIERYINAGAAIGYSNEYLRLSTTLTYSYLFVLPLLVVYEGGLMLLSSGPGPTVRIGADVLIKQVLGLVGLHGTLMFSGLVVVIGAGIFLYERRHDVPLKPRYFALMALESFVYAIVVGSVIGILVGGLFGSLRVPLNTGANAGVAEGFILSLGAGLYEELLFRLILVSALSLLLRALPLGNGSRYAAAAIVGALIFSAAHYVGDFAYAFTLSSFVFRFLMGLVLNALFITRGFGVAAMTHAMYDVIVTVF